MTCKIHRAAPTGVAVCLLALVAAAPSAAAFDMSAWFFQSTAEERFVLDVTIDGEPLEEAVDRRRDEAEALPARQDVQVSKGNVTRRSVVDGRNRASLWSRLPMFGGGR